MQVESLIQMGKAVELGHQNRPCGFDIRGGNDQPESIKAFSVSQLAPPKEQLFKVLQHILPTSCANHQYKEPVTNREQVIPGQSFEPRRAFHDINRLKDFVRA